MKTLKRAFLYILKHMGGFHSIKKSRWRNEKLLILCYHGVSLEDEHEWRPAMSMPSSVFETRLEMLRAGGYSVLPLADAVTKLYSHALPPKSVVITFDDGLYNFYAQAFPLLQKYSFPATLYLTTYYCDHQLPVFPLVCSYMVWKARGRVIPPTSDLGLNHPLDLTTPLGRQRAENDIRSYAEKMHWSSTQQNEFAKRLAESLEVNFDGIVSKRLFHLMTPQEVKDVSQKGVDIQLHTHRHRSPLDRAIFQQEIIENRNKISEWTGNHARHFCYPSGVHRPQSLPWLSEQAVVSATTCDHGIAHARTNPLLLPRFLDSSNVSPIQIESWLTGAGGFLRQLFHGQ